MGMHTIYDIIIGMMLYRTYINIVIGMYENLCSNS